ALLGAVDVNEIVWAFPVASALAGAQANATATNSGTTDRCFLAAIPLGLQRWGSSFFRLPCSITTRPIPSLAGLRPKNDATSGISPPRQLQPRWRGVPRDGRGCYCGSTSTLRLTPRWFAAGADSRTAASTAVSAAGRCAAFTISTWR